MKNSAKELRAFTMVELLSALAIIAVLVAVMVPAIGNYVETARKTADKQTLMVLNDALTRYKTQGGDLSALTAGASIGNVLSKMKTPVTWAGVSHKFLNEGVSYAGASLSAVGSGAQYRFTKYGDYADGTEYSNGIISSYAANGYDVGDEEEFESWLAEAMDETGTTDYIAIENPTDRFEAQLRSLESSSPLYVWWGDGTTEEFTINSGSYTNAAKTFTDSSNRTIILVGKIMWFISNYDDGRSDFGGDISTLTNVQRIMVMGNNTLRGDVANLSSLDTFYLTGTNTVTGDIANLNLNYISVTGNNTLSGDVTNITALTRLYVWGSNTLSGSVSNLTNLDLLGLGGTNTVTGVLNSSSIHFIQVQGNSTIDVDSMISATASSTDMTTFSLGGSYTLTQTQVDTILANFWANRDYDKARIERLISIYQVSHAAPSAAGYTAKANLQAYHSPNDDSEYSVWTVYTN